MCMTARMTQQEARFARIQRNELCRPIALK
jgi:hypothetical protein